MEKGLWGIRGPVSQCWYTLQGGFPMTGRKSCSISLSVRTHRWAKEMLGIIWERFSFTVQLRKTLCVSSTGELKIMWVFGKFFCYLLSLGPFTVNGSYLPYCSLNILYHWLLFNPSFFYYIYIYCVCMYVCICASSQTCNCMCVHVWSEDNLQGSVLSFTTWVLRMKFRLYGLVASAFTRWPISPALISNP